MAAGPMAAGALHTMCRKTKLCKYFVRGRCMRQGDCDFAHSTREMRPVPNLACTKVCPQQQQTGRCDRVGCKFAHDRAEMRKVRILKSGQAAEQTPGTQRKTRGRSATLAETLAQQEEDQDFSTEAGSSGRQVSSSSVDSFQSCMAEAPPPVPAPPTPGQWGGLFRKTVLCHFFVEGRCNRGAACRFAHGESELKAQPDLSRTKLCPKLLLTGTCADPECKYAHSREELRRAEGQESEDQESKMDTPMQATTGFAPTEELHLCVKNTFLTVETLPPTSAVRSRSEPRMSRTSEDRQKAESDSASSTGNSAEDIEDRMTLASEEVSAQSQQSPDQSPTSQLTEETSQADFKSPMSYATETFSFTLEEEAEATAERVRVTVKNTFLTVEEDAGTRGFAVSRARSAPDVLAKLSEESDMQSEGGEDTESTTSEVDSVSSPSNRSVDLDFVFLPVGLPVEQCKVVTGPRLAEVPCCAIQNIEKLEETSGVAEAEVDSCFAMLACKKVFLDPNSYTVPGVKARS